ncbi:MAG: DUF1858 domain-containing protein [Clostridium sp.]|nr:DUF1858 domain-containing protein [Clostridium sp.]
MEVNKSMTIGEIISKNEKAVEILMGFGMGCVGCPSAQAESIEEACQVHGLDVNELIEKLKEI